MRLGRCGRSVIFAAWELLHPILAAALFSTAANNFPLDPVDDDWLVVMLNLQTRNRRPATPSNTPPGSPASVRIIVPPPGLSKSAPPRSATKSAVSNAETTQCQVSSAVPKSEYLLIDLGSSHLRFTVACVILLLTKGKLQRNIISLVFRDI